MKIKKNHKRYIAVIILVLMCAPFVALSADVIVPCENDCDFNDFIKLINNVINFLLFYISMPLAAISFAVAGVKMVLARGNESKVTEAKQIFWYVLMGALIALSAWLVVKAIVVVFFKPAYIFLT
ncbi:MAG: hypothetical protein COZ49_04250 [Candidatus Yonathbacteria bacterium CG_4_10_14_3_um_filter_47_65]|uniref:DUF4134 domain-containing protein n=2 Tax=Parcubacteria group TaxID=1794811 RepID=A0A2M8D8Z6_9BACT|nr:MAG: hypothetical protein AUJ44_00600 [Candidatus Nomurabacteria bacterium CG1_02_47_685]PIP03936.1 MAG: hypothetical protein COX54_01865 [Candidatus Yonathbacteria bacterium CG23_combo_of_CG06-09_8_20_14_all_46_18]PIQ32492.1 MAG: hypothetical protein COW61_01615 [Candidatus Yonathbacteria bacterium CG17_big_fil_post_rev_8_21_14_2_50_46_19]PIX56034.1 MAG: hypothetical protein COZ49_04250 [Candidatus Yonathbacteria bacterium CG_4_10_14_3_um_filter_47_65]PIY57291.1 MAG: hypothetical protein CO